MIDRILLVVLALGSTPPALAQELRVSDRPIDMDEVPPGSREDQLLYHSVHVNLADLIAKTKDVNQALSELKYAYMNLDEIAKDASPDEAKRLRELRARLDGPAKALSDALPREPLFGCRYVLQHLEDSMIGAPGTPAAQRLPQKRAEAQKCDRDMTASLPGMAKGLANLRATLDEVGPEIRERRAAHDKTLADARPAAPAKGDPAAGPTPVPAKADAAAPKPEAAPAPQAPAPAKKP
jgi:hypothetical protein